MNEERVKCVKMHVVKSPASRRGDRGSLLHCCNSSDETHLLWPTVKAPGGQLSLTKPPAQEVSVEPV